MSPAPKGRTVEMHRFCTNCHGKIVRHGVRFLMGSRYLSGKSNTPSDSIFCGNKCAMKWGASRRPKGEYVARAQKSHATMRKSVPNYRQGGEYRYCNECHGKIMLDSNTRWHSRGNDNVFCNSECSSRWGHRSRSVEYERVRLMKSRQAAMRRGEGPFRSPWEEKFAEALDGAGLEWEYESSVFSTPFGITTIDFEVQGKLGTHHIDVKGRETESQTKKYNHLISEGVRLSTVRGMGPEPDWAKAAWLIQHGQMPVGHVFL